MSGRPGIRRVDLRFDAEMGEEGTFLLRCEDCANRGESTAYWPLTKEFWAPSMGLQRCRACNNAHRRRMHKPSIEERRKKARQWYAEDREHRLRYAAEYLALHREKINRLRRERRALTREADNAKKRAYREANKDTINARRRELRLKKIRVQQMASRRIAA